MPKMKTGTALRWNDDRGFGFIKPDDGGNDIFVHRRALGEGRDHRLEEGDRVEYEECYDDRKGKTNAENVGYLKVAEAAAEEAEAEADVDAMIPVTVTAAAAGHATSRRLVDAENVGYLKVAEAAAEEAEAEADADAMIPVTVTAAAAGHATSRHLVGAAAVMTLGAVAVVAAAAKW
eukprot:CAMPEP_0172928626 /NCGR_PEP_ID=MMETSP1075-20121228/218074_1 /TAXON_ID=2916 /ORGANISM="Ceratium fusus, Strain PA161109" /LENGTH=176 /DNA_ID=CAMNT_0013789913 /DNA_START=69 /DNA_END=598 /DNA_ORIENTATION=+